MKVFCYGCKTEEETNWLVRCPKCETMDLGIEQELAWHRLSRLFARYRGWEGDRGTLSLPWFFEKNPSALTEWKAFKAKLIDVETIQPPPNYKEAYSHQDFFDFWLRASGILSLSDRSKADLIDTPILGPLVHQLATLWATHHKQRVDNEIKVKQAEEKARNEEALRKSHPKRKPLKERATL